MKGLIKTQEGVGFLEITDMEEPVLADNEVLINIHVAGICGTDLHIKEGNFKCNPPVALGHEFAGKITRVGPEVKDFKVGDRVVARLIEADAACAGTVCVARSRYAARKGP